VWWVDHCVLDGQGSGKIQPTFPDWVREYIRITRHDPERDGIDPDGTPEERQRCIEEAARSNGRLLVAVIVIGTVVGLAILGTLEWIR
jgi:hypothetical protein